MGLFKMMHDIIGVNKNKLKGSLKEASRKVREQKEKLKNCEKVKRISYKSYKINT